MVKYFWLPLLILVFLAGCADDIILDSGGDLIGPYNGLFFFTEDFGGSSPTTTQVKLNWSFVSDKTFNYSVDNDDPFTDPDHGICDATQGDYDYSNVNFIVFDEVIVGVGICDDNTLIGDTFSFVRVEDTIVLRQIIPSPPTQVLIKLLKIETAK